MFKTNEYFEGKVKSIALEDLKGNATIGAMAPGEYEFGTVDREFMTTITGAMIVKLPGCDEWKTFGKFETFIVEPNQKFQVKVEDTTSYLCRYEKVKEGGCGCGCGCS